MPSSGERCLLSALPCVAQPNQLLRFLTFPSPAPQPPLALRHVFGAFCSEPWRAAPRYFGTGETFVFKLGQQRQAWYWWWKRMEESRNDFFMWGTPEAIAVGGAGG